MYQLDHQDIPLKLFDLLINLCEYSQKYEGRNCDVLLNLICYVTCIVLYHNCACVVLVPLVWFCSFSIYCWCTMFYPSCDLHMICYMTALHS